MLEGKEQTGLYPCAASVSNAHEVWCGWPKLCIVDMSFHNPRYLRNLAHYILGAGFQVLTALVTVGGARSVGVAGLRTKRHGICFCGLVVRVMHATIRCRTFCPLACCQKM
jgi:hypothetical protein